MKTRGLKVGSFMLRYLALYLHVTGSCVICFFKNKEYYFQNNSVFFNQFFLGITACACGFLKHAVCFAFLWFWFLTNNFILRIL